MRIVFGGPRQTHLEDVDPPEAGPGQLVARALVSLISTGTECIALSAAFEPDTSWANWVRFPFYPGYSMIGEVVSVGPGVHQIKPGQRVAARKPHAEMFLAEEVEAATLNNAQNAPIR